MSLETKPKQGGGTKICFLILGDIHSSNLLDAQYISNALLGVRVNKIDKQQLCKQKV